MPKYRIIKETNALGEDYYYVEHRWCFIWWRHIDTEVLSFDPPFRKFSSFDEARHHTIQCQKWSRRMIQEKKHNKMENTIVKRGVEWNS